MQTFNEPHQVRYHKEKKDKMTVKINEIFVISNEDGIPPAVQKDVRSNV